MRCRTRPTRAAPNSTGGGVTHTLSIVGIHRLRELVVTIFLFTFELLSLRESMQDLALISDIARPSSKVAADAEQRAAEMEELSQMGASVYEGPQDENDSQDNVSVSSYVSSNKTGKSRRSSRSRSSKVSKASKNSNAPSAGSLSSSRPSSAAKSEATTPEVEEDDS